MYRKGSITSKPKKLFKYLEQTQIDVILDNAMKSNKRDHLIIMTLWHTRMRCNELTHLKKRDIKDDEVIIHQGKGNKDRLIPIDKSLFILLSYHTASLNLDDRLFPISNAQVRNITHRYQSELDVHPHTFRHSFVVHCLKSGVNIRVLQKILGHSDLNTTAVYLDLIGEDIKDEYKKIDW